MKDFLLKIWFNIIRPFFCSTFDTGVPASVKGSVIKVPYFWATAVNVLNVVAILSILAFGRTELIPLVGIIFVGSIGLIATYNQGKASPPPQG